MKVLGFFLWLTYGLAADSTVTCANCHPKQSIGGNAMRQAMEPVAKCRILQSNPHLTFQNASYSYRLDREGNDTFYTVTGNGGEKKVRILWALGQGAAGQTYIYEQNGNLYESRVSYFEALHGLHLTMGAQNAPPANLEEATGRLMSAKESVECISCHATNATVQGVLHTESIVPGIQCGRCHEGTVQHAKKIETSTTPAKLSNLSTEEMSNFCGKCHRSWEQIAAEGPRNINNLRFQPYRLTNSKCYDVADPRIRCTACHDPHAAVIREPAAYDAKCQSCHSAQLRAAASSSAKVKSCQVGTRECVTCHMPKYELPGAHHAFTDHWIRIVRSNASYPN